MLDLGPDLGSELGPDLGLDLGHDAGRGVAGHGAVGLPLEHDLAGPAPDAHRVIGGSLVEVRPPRADGGPERIAVGLGQAFLRALELVADVIAVDRLIADDKAKVMQTLLRNSGMKSSALEALERSESFTGLDRDPIAETSAGSADKDKEREQPLGAGAGKTPDQAPASESEETEQEQDLGLDRDFGM